MSVSRVINDKPGVGLATRRHIEETMIELNFAFSALTSRERHSRSQLIGLLLPDIANPFFGPVVRGIEKCVGEAGYRLLLCNSEKDISLERRLIHDLIAHRVDGLLIAPVNDSSSLHLTKLVRAKFPIVFFDRVAGTLDCDSVTLDNVGSAKRMVRHLHLAGHRHIAYVTGPDDISASRDRLLGVRQAAAELKLQLVDEGATWTTSDQMGGYRATQHLISQSPRPSAIFTVNNLTAVGAMQAIREAGLQVPQDIALVCFDDVQNLAIMSPFMTVIEQPEQSIGSVAAQMLVERIAGKGGTTIRNVKLPGNLIVRSSCSPSADVSGISFGSNLNGPRRSDVESTKNVNTHAVRPSD
jgi:LacI family transcriptional regulator